MILMTKSMKEMIMISTQTIMEKLQKCNVCAINISK